MPATIVARARRRSICIVLFAVGAGLAAWGEAITIGMGDGWTTVARTENVSFRAGRRGFLDAALGDNEYTADSGTDLLLHFNAMPIQDSAGRYAAAPEGAVATSDYRWLGRGAAVFRNPNETLRLHAGSDSLFDPGTLWSDFSLEFWLYPANLEEGETVLLWMGSRWQDRRPVQQEVRISVSNRTLTWTFTNFFLPEDQSELTIELSGHRSLIPRDWHHHMVRFDAATGLLEYLVDGRPEDVIHVSRSGGEDGTVYFPYVGEASGRTVHLGVGFVGFLDELRLSRVRVEAPRLQRISPHPGTLVSEPLDLEFEGSRVLMIDGEIETPGRSEVLMYYWVGNRRDRMIVEWVPVRPGQMLDPAPAGRYLRIRADLLPGAPTDGRPSVSWIEIDIERDAPPAPPAVVVAEPGDSSVRLDWSAVPEPDVAGYLVYYGTASGQYFGTDADRGPSPVDVGDATSITLDELENGRLYYFAVSAYDASRSFARGTLSREVTARPSGRRQ